MQLPHRSAIVAWSCWSVAFTISAFADPRLVVDVATLSPRLLVIAAAVALFLAVVARLQREMGLALKASSFGEPTALVTTGTFAKSRNPIYLAFLAPLATLAIWSPLGAAVGIVLYLVAMTVIVIRPEEAQLRRVFGARFEEWARATPRWIGLPGRGGRSSDRSVPQGRTERRP